MLVGGTDDASTGFCPEEELYGASSSATTTPGQAPSLFGGRSSSAAPSEVGETTATISDEDHFRLAELAKEVTKPQLLELAGMARPSSSARMVLEVTVMLLGYADMRWPVIRKQLLEKPLPLLQKL